MSPWISTRFLQAQSDERLLAAAQVGHRRAFDILVVRHRKALLGHARRVLGEAGAEDAVQQGLLQAWTALQRGADVNSAAAWLHRIVHNAALDLRRMPDHDHEPLGEVPRSEPSVESEHERRSAACAALAAFATLPDAQREVLQRTAIEGDSHLRVASALGLSEGAVRGLIYRARVALRAAASAVTPTSLIEWAARAERHGTRFSQRLAGSGIGSGSVGIAVLKGGAAAVTAGALAVGATVVRNDHGAAHAVSGRAALGHEVGVAALPSLDGLAASGSSGTRVLDLPPARSRGHAKGRGGAAGERSRSSLGRGEGDGVLGTGADATVRGDDAVLSNRAGSPGSDGGSSGGGSDLAGSGGVAGVGSAGGSGSSGDGGSSGAGTQTSSDGGAGVGGSDGGGSGTAGTTGSGGSDTSQSPSLDANATELDGGSTSATTSSVR